MRINIMLFVLCALCAAGGRLWSAEDPPKAAAPAKAPQVLAKAGELEKAGMTAMEESNSKPSRSVDAALAFTSALKLYEVQGEEDKVREMHADIFWCKKRMNVDDLQKYLKSKGDDAVLVATVEKMNQVADQAVPKEQADDYFKRAQDYAARNPDRQFLIAIRYYEVAQRFQGSEVSLQAQRLSLDAQEAHLKSIQIAKEVKRETLFSRPAVADSGEREAAPSAADQKASLAAIKKLYKDEYAASGKREKKASAHKLFEQAKATKDDLKIRFVLFSEAVNFAVQAEDINGIIAYIDEASRYYATGFDALAEKKAALGKIKRLEAAAAVLKLFDNADDAAANFTVGRYYALEVGQWDIGLPLLAVGSDPDYKRLAEMELEKPAGAQQQLEVGDRWYDLGAKARSPVKDQLWGRAHYWYKQAFPALSGLSKERVSQRLDELFGLVPDPTINYADLSDKQWEKIKAPIVEVSAGKLKTPTGVMLKAGQKLRIIPHPTDTWNCQEFSKDAETTVNYKGIVGHWYAGAGNRLATMALVCWVVESAKKLPGVLDGPGAVFVGPNDFYSVARKGVIRVKLMLLDDE